MALETLEAADQRRWHETVTWVQKTHTEAMERFGVMFTSLAEQAQETARIVNAWLSLWWPPEGYYVRDGKLRRNHSYFRQRAKLRRQRAKYDRLVRQGKLTPLVLRITP